MGSQKDVVYKSCPIILQSKGFPDVNTRLFLRKLKDSVDSKGFPDVNTRLFLRKLKDSVDVPLYALVDADPYGIEIMCVYRYGSLTLSPQALTLACPEIQWLGIHPTDIRHWASNPGPSTLSPQALTLACPEIQWLGIHPTDIRHWVIPTIPMTERDLSKLRHLLTRPFIMSNKKLLKE
ncbi:meiotic recombination protein SPO11-like, partial [Diaphorina citri]|uniref:Meiotic recombination protein SPO11-like n=1 Tax=Diaphorina citri TaxID=121845 RepID=A0A3Q0JHR6_DIACI